MANREVYHGDYTSQSHLRVEDNAQRENLGGFHCRVHTKIPITKKPLEKVNPEHGWRSSGKVTGVGIVLTTPKGSIIKQSYTLGF